MQRLRIFPIAACLAMVSACSNTFLYNQLDWIVPWYVDDFVDLDRAQRQNLKESIRELLVWHRGEELETYLEIFDGIEADLAGEVTASQVENWANRAYAAYQRVEERMLPVAFDLGNSLSDEQMEQFIENLREGQRDLEEKYLERSDEEYREDARDNLGDAMADTLGRLTPDQESVLENASGQLQRFDGAWLDEREQWLDTLSDLLQRRPGWEGAVRKALDEREANRTDSYRSAYAHNALIINQAIADVLNLRTEKQSRRLLGEIEDYRRDIRKLISQAD